MFLEETAKPKQVFAHIPIHKLLEETYNDITFIIMEFLIMSYGIH